MITKKQTIDIINKRFGKGKLSRSGENIAVACIFCNKSNALKKKLSINIENFQYHCWVCGSKGSDIRKFIPELKKTARKDKVDIDLSSNRKIFLPEEFVLLDNFKTKCIDKKFAIRYLMSRGLSEKDAIKNGIGACFSGEYKNRIFSC